MFCLQFAPSSTNLNAYCRRGKPKVISFSSLSISLISIKITFVSSFGKPQRLRLHLLPMNRPLETGSTFSLLWCSTVEITQVYPSSLGCYYNCYQIVTPEPSTSTLLWSSSPSDGLTSSFRTLKGTPLTPNIIAVVPRKNQNGQFHNQVFGIGHIETLFDIVKRFPIEPVRVPV